MACRRMRWSESLVKLTHTINNDAGFTGGREAVSMVSMEKWTDDQEKKKKKLKTTVRFSMWVKGGGFLLRWDGLGRRNLEDEHIEDREDYRLHPALLWQRVYQNSW